MRLVYPIIFDECEL